MLANVGPVEPPDPQKPKLAKTPDTVSREARWSGRIAIPPRNSQAGEAARRDRGFQGGRAGAPDHPGPPGPTCWSNRQKELAINGAFRNKEKMERGPKGGPEGVYLSLGALLHRYFERKVKGYICKF